MKSPKKTPKKSPKMTKIGQNQAHCKENAKITNTTLGDTICHCRTTTQTIPALSSKNPVKNLKCWFNKMNKLWRIQTIHSVKETKDTCKIMYTVSISRKCINVIIF